MMRSACAAWRSQARSKWCTSRRTSLGSGERSPLEGRQVEFEAVVVAPFGGLGGVFVQSLAADDDPATSEGLFLPRSRDAQPRLKAGDHVRITGTVVETGDDGNTLTAVDATGVERLGQAPVTPLVVTTAPASPGDWERYEGMLLTLAGPLTVVGNEDLARYGELRVSFDGRLFTPTELAPPGTAAQAITAENARLMLRLDDGRSARDPDRLWFLPGERLEPARPLRVGSVLHEVTGVLDQRFGGHRLRVTQHPLVGGRSHRERADFADEGGVARVVDVAQREQPVQGVVLGGQESVE